MTTTATSKSKSATPISPDASKVFCRMMNEQHGADIMAMALDQLTWADRGYTVSTATMTKLTLYDIYISYAVCKGTECQMRNKTIPFVPPLTSDKDVEARMEQIHDKVLVPDVFWLFQPLAMLILLVCSSATVAKFVIGQDAITDYILSSPIAYERVMSLLGSVPMVNYLISFVFWTSVVGHGTEACFVAYQCQTCLELNIKNTATWFILVSMVGYPILTKFNVLLKAQMTGESKAKISYRKNK